MSTHRIVPLVATALAVSALGCDDPVRRYGSDLSFPETQVLLERSPRRIDLEVTPAAGFVLVNELRVKDDDELLNDEILTMRLEESAFRELTTEGECAGTIVGTPAGEVRFDEAFTEFSSEDATTSCGDFVSQLRDLVDGGSAPLVQARRTSGATPQDPDDAVFFARELTIAASDSAPDEGRDLRLNVGADSLATCGAMGAPRDCVGALMLLDRPFVAIDDVSELKADFPLELIEFRLDDAVVRSASASAGRLVLSDGTIVQILDGTRIDGAKPNGEPPSDTQLTTAQAVEDAIASGQVVQVDGRAVLQSTVPISLVAVRVDIQIDPDATAPATQTLAFQAPVLSVTPEVGIVTLPLETDVSVTKATEITGDFTTLTALRDAVGNGAQVRAEVVGTVERAEPRLVVSAKSLRLTSRRVQP